MEKIKARYAGRLQGLLDGLGCKYSLLTPEEYFGWYSEKERYNISMKAIQEANCIEVVNKLVQLTKTARRSSYSGRAENEENINEYKLGLREGQLAAKNGSYSSLLS